MAKQKIYKKPSILFYENDKDIELYHKINELAQDNSDSFSTYIKRLIIDHVNKEK